MTDEIDRWIKYMKENPNTWKAKHTEFINAQFDKAYRFIDKLSKTQEGKQKIISIYSIKNTKGYPKLLH